MIPSMLSSSWERLEDSNNEGWKPIRNLLPSSKEQVPRSQNRKNGSEKVKTNKRSEMLKKELQSWCLGEAWRRKRYISESGSIILQNNPQNLKASTL